MKQGDGVSLFQLLFEVVNLSNAEEVRIFCDVCKNKTKFRANLSKDTLPSILTRKTNGFNKMDCYRFEPSKDLLQKAKSA